MNPEHDCLQDSQRQLDKRLPRLKGNDAHAQQSHGNAHDIPARRSDPVNRPEPQDGRTDVDATIGGVHPAGGAS